MTEVSGFNYFNKQNSFGGANSMYGSATSNSSASTDLSSVKDIGAYVHNFFSNGEEDLMSSMQFPGQSLFAGGGNQFLGADYGSQCSSNYDSKYDKSQYASMIKEAAARHGVDPKLAMKIAETESHFKPGLTSPTGNYGLFQLGDSTARQMKVNRYDVKQNIDGGVKYLAYLQKRYNGNLTKTVAAYNAGPGAVDKYGGVPNYGETQRYVRKVLG